MSRGTLRNHWFAWKLLGRGLGIAFLVWLAVQLWPVRLQPGPETTVIAGPLRANGTIDYAAALNAECSQGVTPENNAVVLLVWAIGPGTYPAEKLAPEYFRELGIDPLPAEGPYLTMAAFENPQQQNRLWKEYDEASSKPWSDEDYPDLAEWLADNEEPLRLCAEAVHRERFYDPIIVGPDSFLIGTLNPTVSGYREIARLLSLRAMRHLGDHNLEAALEDAETLHRLSRMLGQHPMLITQLTAYAFDSLACDLDGQILTNGLLSAEMAQQRRALLNRLPSFPPLAQTIDRSGRFDALDGIQLTVKETPGGSILLDCNVLLRNMNETYNDSVAALKLPTLVQQREALIALEDTLGQRAKQRGLAVDYTFLDGYGLAFKFGRRRATSEGAADVMAALSIEHLKGVANVEFRNEARHRLASTGFAIAEYRAVHGDYPVTLDALVPDYLASIPADPFTGESIRYAFNADRGTFLVYSLGENGVDNHGLMNDQNNTDDISFGDVPKGE